MGTSTTNFGFTKPTVGGDADVWGGSTNTNWDTVDAQLAYLSSGFLYGLTLSNSSGDATNDIDVAAGVAIDGTNVKTLRLAASITKRLDASWAVGTNQGGLDTGSIANVTYHVWLIMRSDTGVVDVLFSASASAPTMPSNYDYKRRIGSIVRVSAAIKAFVQVGDIFRWKTAVRDVNVSNQGTSAVQYALTVPTGLTTIEAFGSFYCSTNATRRVRIYSPQTNDDAASESGAGVDSITVTGGGDSDNIYSTGSFRDLTNTGGALFAISDGANTVLQMWTKGWIDYRGRLAA